MDSTAWPSWVGRPFTSIAARSSFFPPSGRVTCSDKNDPIPRHLKLQVSLVAAGGRFLGVGEPRTHPRVRHVGLDRNDCAPVTGLPAASANLKVMVAGPTRAGSGEISCSIAMRG